jgi:hypothetical protein
MTRLELRSRIFNALNVSATSPIFWTTSEMNDILNEAQEAFAEEAKAIHRTALVSLRAGASYYTTASIAADMLAPYRLWMQSTDRRLTAVSLDQLDRYHERWLESSGTPEVWCPISWDWFAVYPHPTVGGGIIRVDYIAFPRDLQHDDDKPEFYESDQEALIYYGVYQGLLKRWDLATALDTYGRFVEWMRVGVANSGVRVRESQAIQQGSASGTPYRSDIGSRWT